MKHYRTRIGIFCVLVFVVCSVFGIGIHNTVSAATYGVVNTDNLNFREQPTTSAAKIGVLQKGTKVTILGSTKDTTGRVWYKITAPVSGKNRTGYVSSEYITKENNSGSSTNKNTTTTTSTFVTRYGYIKGHEHTTGY